MDALIIEVQAQQILDPPMTWRKCPICEAARRLIAQGVDPETPINQRTLPSKILSWAVSHPLSYWADRSVSKEGKMIKHTPYPENLHV